MAPTLVVANAPYKVFPGGIIAIRCTDWLGAARGSLTTEVDARAVTGEAVRDAQTVATSIFSNPIGAYQEADDSLEIDFSLLPIEGAASNGMPYRIFLSLLIEGDWDTADDDTYRGSNQYEFLSACGIGFHGVPGSVTDADPGFTIYKPRHRPHYVIVQLTSIGDLVGDEVMFIRAYASAGTSIEILLDQIYLIPLVTSGTKMGQWTSNDFALVGGQHNTFGVIGYDPPETGTGFVDGADGGDANGKFTWMPFPEEENVNLTGADGGGDYQKDPDDEYMARVVVEDFYDIQNSYTGAEASAHAYSLHGSNYRDDEWWMEDSFARTVASGWGTSPQGFGWWGAPTPQTSVNGTRGVTVVGNGSAYQLGLYTGWGAGPNAAIIRPSDLIATGFFEYSAIPTSLGPGFLARLNLAFQDVSSGDANFTHELLLNPVAKTWWLQGISNAAGGRTTFHGPVDISAWFGAGAVVGFKMEAKRYLFRVKIWDASGAEPGTWDYEGLAPAQVPTPGPLVNYSWSDDLLVSTSIGRKWDFFINPFSIDATSHTIYWDDIKIGSDPYGTPGDMTAVMEQPNGTQVGTIDIPYGAWQMVYWGARDWTALDAGDPYLNFSSKVWNESGTAELQRAEAPFWYFRSVHGGLIPMNWRSSERPGSVWRVLVGDR